MKPYGCIVALSVLLICFALFIAAPHDFFDTLVENKDADSISIRGFLTLTTIYADKNEIDHIYQLIKQECVNLKVK